MSNISKAEEWRAIGRYNDGKADALSSVINLYHTALTPQVLEYLYSQREASRAEAIRAYDEAIKVLNSKEQ